MIDAVPEPASTLIAAAAFTGARRGELRAMFWENYREGELLIARSIWNGITTDPKSRTSKAPIPIIPKLATKLEAHGARLGKPKTGPIFPNGAGYAIDPDSIWSLLCLEERRLRARDGRTRLRRSTWLCL
jgi:hypothetical protein